MTTCLVAKRPEGARQFSGSHSCEVVVRLLPEAKLLAVVLGPQDLGRTVVDLPGHDCSLQQLQVDELGANSRPSRLPPVGIDDGEDIDAAAADVASIDHAEVAVLEGCSEFVFHLMTEVQVANAAVTMDAELHDELGDGLLEVHLPHPPVGWAERQSDVSVRHLASVPCGAAATRRRGWRMVLPAEGGRRMLDTCLVGKPRRRRAIRS
jgi:hypothetical protein